jgi:hypothetical protein
MQLALLVAGSVLLGQGPGDPPLPPAAQVQPPAVLQPIADVEPPATGDGEVAVPQTAPAPIRLDDGLKSEAQTPRQAGADNPSGETPPASLPPAGRRLPPPEMVAQALVLPLEGRLKGRRLTLLAALSSTADRRQQIEVTHAYWRLTETVAVYCFSLDHERQLQGLEAGGDQAAELRTARASSAALVQEAEVAVVAAQHELAALALLSPDAPLPLPADRPHVGPYRTYFAQLFSLRTPPARTRLIDRTLPVLYRAVDARAAAAQAAQDALAAAVDAYPSGRADLPAVLACMEEYLRQRQAFIRAVCRYNHQIADYALAVAGPGSNGQTLVGMLISPTPHSLRPLASGGDGWLEPAAHITRVPTPPQRPGQKKPTPARRPGQKEPTPASPQTMPRESDQEVSPPATSWSLSPPSGKDQPGVVPQREETDSPRSPSPEQPPVPVEPKPAEPIPRTISSSKYAERVAGVDGHRREALVGEPPDPRTSRGSLALDPGHPKSDQPNLELLTVDKPLAEVRENLCAPALYPALAGVSSEAQAKQLTLTLHRDRTLPEGIGERVSLGECLSQQSGGDRRELIGAYWLVRQRAAEYQVVVQQAQLLEDLLLVAHGPQHPAGLRLSTARVGSEAARYEAHAALLEAQFELATRMGRESDPAWPMPSTVPRSDPYPLRLDAQPARLAESWPVRRLAAMIPGLDESLRRRAAAVVEADAARAAATSQADGRSIEPLLSCIRRQTEQTFAFLATLTEYNRAIAEYALTVLPPETSPDKLAAALMAAQGP